MSPSGRGWEACSGPVKGRFLLLLACLLVSVASGQQQVVQGDLGIWDSIFDSRRADEVVHIPGPSWTEGPQIWDTSVIFSDTIKNRIYRWNRRAGSHIMLDDSGQAPPDDREWMAEPGSNAIAMDHRRPNTAYVCQHGNHAVSRLNLLTRELTPLATEYKGTRLNGPNDIVLDKRGRYVYFTDPIYSYLRKDAFHDAEYLDEACGENLGFKGVFRLRLGRPGQEPELLEGTRHQRPNGIAFSPDFTHLYVSDCCQGSHLSNCTQGDAIFTVYRVQEDGGLGFVRSIRFRVEGEAGSRGCADGFKVDPRTGHIVASCPMGICIVGTGVPLEPVDGAAVTGVGGVQGSENDDDGDDIELTGQPEEDLLPPDAADADADLGEAGTGTKEEEEEEKHERVEADYVAEAAEEDLEEKEAEDDEERLQREEEEEYEEIKAEEKEEEEEDQREEEEEERGEGAKDEGEQQQNEGGQNKEEEQGKEEDLKDEEEEQQEEAIGPDSSEESAAAAEEEEEEKLKQEEQEEGSGPDSTENLAAGDGGDDGEEEDEMEEEEREEASAPDSSEESAAAAAAAEEVEEEEKQEEEEEASAPDSNEDLAAAAAAVEDEEEEKLKQEEEEEASAPDSSEDLAAADDGDYGEEAEEMEKGRAKEADGGSSQGRQDDAVRREDAAASRGVSKDERPPQQKSESESSGGGGGTLPPGARTAAQAHRMRTQKASARRLLMSSGGGAGEPDDEDEGRVIGLLARLHLGHRVSNVVFGNDGFLYTTGESKHGGGALMRIPLRHYPAAGGSHDELRRRRRQS